jgi:hypothetical protein
MRRVSLLLVLVVLAGCNREGAIQAVIHYDASVRASCIALEVLGGGDEVLRTLRLERPADPERKTLTVAIFRGDLPEEVQLQARALWGNGCTSALANNGQSALVTGQFKAGEVSDVNIDLQRPSKALDDDEDGYIGADHGGPDCDDTRQDHRPGVEELCDGTDDLNCDNKRGCDDSTCAGKACARAPSSLLFTSGAFDATAGTCSPPVVVERRDSQNQASEFGFPTPLTLQTTVSGGVMFYADASCSSSVDPTIPAGKSSLTFYVRGTKAGQGELSASATALTAATVTHSVVAGPGITPLITTPPNTLRAGECVPFTVEWRDAFDNPALGHPNNITLTTGMDAKLYQDAACQQAVTPAFLARDVQSLPLYFSGPRTGTTTIVVEGTTSLKAQQAQTVRPNVPTAFVVEGTAPQTLFAGECSSAMTVRMFDRFNNPTSFDAATPLGLSSNSTGDFGFYVGAGCTGTPVSALTLAAGATSAGFSFKGKTGGPVTLTAALSNLTPVSQNHTLIPLVRRGRCLINTNQTASTGCTIDPPVRDLTKSFLVFQATSSASTVRDAFVKCQLTQNQVTCNRVGTAGVLNIQWQVVERPTGLRVQHVPVDCAGTKTTTTITSVSRDKSLLLFSSSQDGGQVGVNEFMGVQFASPTQVEFLFNSSVCNSTDYALQVVEWDGLVTSQGATGAMSGTSLTTTATPAVPDLARTVLLSTHQATDESDADICNRLVRGELTSDTGMSFSIAADQTCSAPKVPSIHWQRITFPMGTLVNTATLTAATSSRTTTSAEFPTAVDPTRTLLLTSSQAHGGQGSGESGYRTIDTPGEAAGRLTLTANNKQIQLERDSVFAQSRWTAYAIQLEP